MKITIDQFHGESPKTAPHLLSPQQASNTRNCDLRSGNLKSLKMPAKADSTAGGIKPKTIYLFNAQGENPVWFESELELDILRGPLPDDTEERTYITGMGAPRYTFSSIATKGVGPYPSQTRMLGVPAPKTAPFVNVVAEQVDPEDQSAGFDATIALNEEGGIETIDLVSGGSGYTGTLSAVIKDVVPAALETVCRVNNLFSEDAIRDGITTEDACMALSEPETQESIYSLVIDGETGEVTSISTQGVMFGGYNKEDTVVAAHDPQGLGSGCVIEPVWSEDGSSLIGVDLVSGGSGYTDQSVVQITGTIRSWSQPVIVGLTPNGGVESVSFASSVDLSVFKEGSTTVELIDPHTWGAGAKIEPEWVDGALAGVNVTESGSGYPADVTVEIAHIQGTGAKIKVLAVDGVVQPVQIEAKGSGYTNPEIVLTNSYSSSIDTNSIPSSTAYVYTFVTDKGEEGPPSPPSVLFDRYNGQDLKIEITQNTVAGEGYAIEKIRVYRYAQGASSGDYFFVGEVLVGDASFIDNLLDMDLPGGMLETTDYDPPPEDMTGLVSLTNGMMAGFSGREVCFCEPYLPYAWPVKYRMTVDFDVVGLGSLGNGVVVLTTGQPYLIMGTHPEVMGMDKLDISQSCVSKRSIVSFGGGVAFASPDGLYMISQNGSQNLTRDIMTREQWQGLNPDSILGGYDEGRYLGFFDSNFGKGSFALDSTNPNATFTKSSVFADAVFRDLITDQVYIVDNDDGVWTGADDSPLWRSKKFKLPKPSNLSAFMVLGEGMVGVSVYADGRQVFSNKVDTQEVIRLPSGFLARDWEFELSGFDVVDQIDSATSVMEITHG